MHRRNHKNFGILTWVETISYICKRPAKMSTKLNQDSRAYRPKRYKLIVLDHSTDYILF